MASNPSQLREGLVLRPVQDAAEAERWAAFNGTYNNAHEGAVCACLVRHHPRMPLDHFWLVEDTANGEIVSTTCLIPWSAKFCGIELRLTQLEMVLTHPAYRGRGLVRAQMENFHRLVQTGGCDLSIIWGIPYYYRQFGYTYTLDGLVTETLSTRQIPDSEPCSPQFAIRPGVRKDIPAMVELLESENWRLDFHIQRNLTEWDYLLHAAGHPYEVLCGPQDGRILGYVFTQRQDSQVTIRESAIPDTTLALAYLSWLKSQGATEVNVNGPGVNSLAKTAHSLGGARRSENQWLVRLPDLAALLMKLAPVLHHRLERDGGLDFSGQLTINLYHMAYRLRFGHNRLLGVDALGFVDASMGADGGDLCIPSEAFTRLLTGYRSLEQLRDAWPDIVIKPQVLPLVEALFPILSGYLYTPYEPFLL